MTGCSKVSTIRRFAVPLLLGGCTVVQSADGRSQRPLFDISPPSPPDSIMRKQLIDNALQRTNVGHRPQFGLGELDSAMVLRSLTVDAVQVGAVDDPNVLINPEPSSLLVWSTLAGGVFAAGYGFRHRRSVP